MKAPSPSRGFNRNRAIKAVLSGAKRLGLTRYVIHYVSRYMNSPRRLARGFKGYEPNAQDVFVSTFLRSGTNWMMQMALQTAHRGRADFDHIHDLVAWPDSPDSGPIDLRDSRCWEGSPTGLRVIKTHADAGIVPVSPEAKYLVVLRDPKEVMVSAYHFATALLGIADVVTPEQWLGQFVRSSGAQPSRWLEHTLSWWALRDRPNIEVMLFSEMKKDHRGAVERVARLMDVELEASELEAVLERSSLAYMKANNARFEPVMLPFAEPTHVPKMVRRGVSRGAEEMYSREQLASIDETVLEQLERTGSDFPYRELFESYAQA